MGDLLLILLILIITYFTGSILEKNHFKKIKAREIALVKKPVVSFGKKLTTNKKIKKVEFVTGEVVISGDYFKNFVSAFRNFFGGRMVSFESLMDRARREALLRMREKAKTADIIVNARLESTMLNICEDNSNNLIPQVAVIAYGTAVTYERWK